MKTVLVTGCAGFIGFHTAQALLEAGHRVVGIDCLNEYYDVTLKRARLGQLDPHPNFTFTQLDLSDRVQTAAFFKDNAHITHVIHLAAQPGVRYSLENPLVYGDSNLIGYLTLLEGVRSLKGLQHFIYASSSSVYGNNEKQPFEVSDRVDRPISLYAATKRANELMAISYAHLFQIPTTGLRYFTVYGPWGRPDMAVFLFTRAMLAGEEIKVFNHGRMRRNYSFVGDIVAGTLAALDHAPGAEQAFHRLYNLGNDRSDSLMDFIHTLERVLGVSARLKYEPLQPGDVVETVADISAARHDLGYDPKTSIEEGLTQFAAWYKAYYNQGLDAQAAS
ncbi:MAG: SDR family NAD(P)-dependent oxidoreductase [Proteobacteria bacterium]|nr:SDR family NAD(P)-dependent oxidoreductase [Pseudomonadota bacterium]